jgi:hypothetical protein
VRITNAWIDDPTLIGEVEPPGLCVEVTEMPDVTITPETFSGGWTVGKYGPFVHYEGPNLAEASDFNIRFRGRFPAVVDIDLFIGKDMPSGKTGFSLPLTRARQLVKKYDSDWRLTINDRAAESGSLLWLPTQTRPACRSWVDDRICGRVPSRPIRVKDVDFPMCEMHLQEHNKRHAEKRARKAS